MTIAEYEALKKQLESAQTKLAQLEKESVTLKEMITAVATTLAKSGPTLDPPVINLINDRTIGTGINQLTYSGTWTDLSKSGLSEGNGRYSRIENDYVELRWYGFKAEVITEKWENHGK